MRVVSSDDVFEIMRYPLPDQREFGKRQIKLPFNGLSSQLKPWKYKTYLSGCFKKDLMSDVDNLNTKAMNNTAIRDREANE